MGVVVDRTRRDFLRGIGELQFRERGSVILVGYSERDHLDEMALVHDVNEGEHLNELRARKEEDFARLGNVIMLY